MTLKIRIATLKSELALLQVDIVKSYLGEDVETETIKVSTSGDKILNKSLSEIGGKGLFIKELEYFILNGEVGVQEVYANDAYGDDITDGLWVFGIDPGPSTTIIFPISVDISRFENAMWDLMDECPGIKSKY